MGSGLLDLEAHLEGATKVLIAHTPQWFSPIAQDYPFDPKAECPRWYAFLDRCLEGDEGRIQLLQEWFGYCLTPDTSQQKALFLVGEGANGKSVAVEVLKHVAGPSNCSHVPLEIFGQRFQLTMTLGKLVNICGDIGELDKTAEGFIKQFTGGDAMYFDRKCIPGVHAKPTARLIVAMNNRPRFHDRTDGIWRRLIEMPWRVRIPDEEQDKTLLNGHHPDWPFRPELPGIFNWSIEGLQRLREKGEFTIPSICREAADEYRMESNPAKMFLIERCEENRESTTSVRELYLAYNAWCHCYNYRPLAESAFGKEIRRCYPHVVKKRLTVRGVRLRDMYYVGIQLRRCYVA
jgi:putative DNA primase/helicase